jgi:hypothetical protein
MVLVSTYDPDYHRFITFETDSSQVETHLHVHMARRTPHIIGMNSNAFPQ